MKNPKQVATNIANIKIKTNDNIFCPFQASPNYKLSTLTPKTTDTKLSNIVEIALEINISEILVLVANIRDNVPLALSLAN